MSKYDLIRYIHESPIKMIIHSTGGGTSIINSLVSVPGCSNTLLNATVPYHFAASTRLLDLVPSSFVSSVVSRDLAYNAWMQAQQMLYQSSKSTDDFSSSSVKLTLSTESSVKAPGDFIIGVGITCALQTNRKRKGSDKVYLSIWSTGAIIKTYYLELHTEDTRSVQEERIHSLFMFAIYNFIGTFCIAYAKSKEAFTNFTFNAKPEEIIEEYHYASPLLITDASTEVSTALCSMDDIRSHTHTSLVHFPAVVVQLWIAVVHKFIYSTIHLLLFNSNLMIRTDYEPYFSSEYKIAKLLPVKSVYPGECVEVPLLFAGSFNPMHYGHTQLAKAAMDKIKKQPHMLPSYVADYLLSLYRLPDLQESTLTNSELDCNFSVKSTVTYEISLHRVEKNSLESLDSVLTRLSPFLNSSYRLVLTKTPYFHEKARLFPHHGFIIGFDTLERLLDLKYYNNCKNHWKEAMLAIKNNGCFFIVGGRLNKDASSENSQRKGTWQDSSSIIIPYPLSDMIVHLSKEEFRIDISSTEIRNI